MTRWGGRGGHGGERGASLCPYIDKLQLICTNDKCGTVALAPAGHKVPRHFPCHLPQPARRWGKGWQARPHSPYGPWCCTGPIPAGQHQFPPSLPLFKGGTTTLGGPGHLWVSVVSPRDREPAWGSGTQDCVGDVETEASEPMAWLRGWTGQGRYGEWVLGPMWVVDAIHLHDRLRLVIGM